MKINKISDLQIGKEYSLVLLDRGSTHYIFKLFAIINEYGHTELYGALRTKRQKKFQSTNLFYSTEIGLGTNLKEAQANYGTLPRFEAAPKAFSSFEEAQKRWEEFL